MRYLFDSWDKISEGLKGHRTLIFLDFDGTLAPIVGKPELASMDTKTRGLLAKVAAARRAKIVVISGRSLKDLKEKVGLKGIIYAGNHGLEIEGPSIRYRYPVPGCYRRALVRIKKRAAAALGAYCGAILEDKGLSLSVHYRLARKKDIPEIIGAVKGLVSRKEKKYIKLRYGKKVAEAVPNVGWHKGKAVSMILSRQKGPCVPVYLGDDITDEDAFRVLRNSGITVFVGRPRRSRARYFLAGTDDVMRFLKKWAE